MSLIIFSFVILALFSENTIKSAPEKLTVLQKAYPDLIFTSRYDEANEDWKIRVKFPEGKNFREKTYLWQNGGLVPEKEVLSGTKYWTLLYGYQYKKPLRDPANYTSEEVAFAKKFGSDDNRKNDAGTPMFFFDDLYESYNKTSIENHIKSIKFLNKSVRVHERIIAPLSRVETKIYEQAKINKDVDFFVKDIKTLEAYFWRLIAGTNRKSFHSLGIAVDIQPVTISGKEIFWGWTKQKNPTTWMLTPLKNRWMPPQKVIDIFEEEGFIWGGKWTVWDNMHFEYHPELIENAKYESELSSAN